MFCMLLHMINVKHICQWLSFFVYPWGSGSIWLYPCLICGECPQGTFTPVRFTEYFLCLRQFWIIIFWSYEPCRYFTAGNIVERWTLLMLTTGHVVLCEMFPIVDKLEAVSILCVEQLVSSLFCINASQNVIISLWRTVLFCCSSWNITVFSGRITCNM